MTEAYRDYLSRSAAERRSAAILKLRGGDWRPAGVASDGFVYPEGEWAGEPVGGGRPVRPEKCICTGAVPVEEGAGRFLGRFLVLDSTGSAVSEDEIKRESADEDPERETPQRARA